MATLNQVEEVVSIAAYVAKFGQPLTVPPDYSGDANASTELIPIQLKNAFNRDNFPGHATIETQMHTMKKAGDALEKDIGEAIAWVQAESKKIVKDITNYVHHQIAARTAGMTMPGRAGQAVAAVILFVKQVLQLVKDLQYIITALADLIRYLITIIQRIQAFMQRILSAITTLINQICNFHLPRLPSIPNLFGGLHFDGFKFTKGMFKFQLSFDTKFAFGNCQVRNLGLNPFSTILQNFDNAAPLTSNPSGYIGSPMTSTYKAYFIPPLSGVVLPTLSTTVPVITPSFSPETDYTGSLPAPSAVVSDYKLPASELKSSATSLIGSPIVDENPSGVVGVSATSIYPATTIPYSQYIAPMRSFFQAKVTLANIEALSTGTNGSWDTAKFNPGGDQTTTPTWVVCWSWLTFMNQCRGTIPVSSTSPNVAATPVTVHGGPTNQVPGRGGSSWIPTFQKVFDSFVNASSGDRYHDINDPIPWNAGSVSVAAAAAWAANPVGDPPTAITPVAGAQDSGPASVMAFFHTLSSMPVPERSQVLWMLSYLEASLLGYPRSSNWDAYAPDKVGVLHPLAAEFSTGPTGLDLDYQQLVAPAIQTATTIELGSGGKANYPSAIEVPNYLVPVMTQVIGWASASILNDPDYASTNLRNMYVYTASATAVAINSYSQFWRDFAANWTALRGRPDSLQAMAFNYPVILASALNPRSGCAITNQGQGVAVQDADPFTLLVRDFTSRQTKFLYHYADPNSPSAAGVEWAPGWPWSDVPSIAQVLIPATDATVPTSGTYGSPTFVEGTPDGWDRVADPDDPGQTILSGFNPTTFYERSDIKALPYTEQQALCYLNQAMDDTVNTGAQLLQDNQASINSCNASLDEAKAQLANIESMATTPMKDSNGNTYYMDAQGVALITSDGTASLPPFTDAYFPPAEPHVPVPPYTPIPTFTPATDSTGAMTTNLPGQAYPAVPQTSTGAVDFTDANTPVDSMYTSSTTTDASGSKAALRYSSSDTTATSSSDLPSMPSQSDPLYTAPTSATAAPSLLKYRQQIFATVPAPIVIEDQTGNSSASIGSSISFSVTASASTSITPLMYQWQKQTTTDGVTAFTNLTGATAKASTYVIDAVTADMNQSVYRCVVSSTFGSPVNSVAITLTVSA